MAKKTVAKEGSKKAFQQMVEKSLGALLIKLDPDIGEKKLRKKIKEGTRILLKGIKVKKEKAEPAEEPKKTTTTG